MKRTTEFKGYLTEPSYDTKNGCFVMVRAAHPFERPTADARIQIARDMPTRQSNVTRGVRLRRDESPGTRQVDAV